MGWLVGEMAVSMKDGRGAACRAAGGGVLVGSCGACCGCGVLLKVLAKMLGFKGAMLSGEEMGELLARGEVVVSMGYLGGVGDWGNGGGTGAVLDCGLGRIGAGAGGGS